MSAGDVLINAAGGAAVAFLGTWVISLVRSTKLIDAERQREATTLGERLIAAEKKLEKPPHTAAEERHYMDAKSGLADLGAEAAEILKHLIVHDEMMFTLPIGTGTGQLYAQTPIPSGMDARKAHTLLNRCMGKNLVSQRTVQRQTGAVYPVSDVCQTPGTRI